MSVIDRISTTNAWSDRLKEEVNFSNKLNAEGILNKQKKMPLHETVKCIDSLAQELLQQKLEFANSNHENLIETFGKIRKMFLKVYYSVALELMDIKELYQNELGLKSEEDFQKFVKLLGTIQAKKEETFSEKKEKLSNEKLNALKLYAEVNQLNDKYFYFSIPNKDSLESKISSLKEEKNRDGEKS